MGRIAIVIVMLAASRAGATTFRVTIAPHGAPAWQADAVADALTTDLADHDFRAASPAEVTVHGELAPRELRYVITSKHAPVLGVIELAGLDRYALAGKLRDKLHAIVATRAVLPGPPAALAAPPGLAILLIGLAALLVAPLAVAVARRQRVWQLRATPRIALALVAIAVVAVVFERATPALILLAGGLAWGAFAAVLLPVALPPLAGLQRVEPGELVPTLWTWLVAAVQRIAWLALWLVPAGWAIDRYAGDVGLAVVAPSIGLIGYLAWLALVETVTQRLDRDLVDGDATIAQPWHAHVRAYFVGYMRRANLDVDEPRLARVRFLPGKGDELAVYGGGLTDTRVVIPRAMLEHALAPYGRPHDYATARVSTLHWTNWNAGLVMPTEAEAKLASQADRQPHETRDEADAERIALGEPPTLAGIIEPVALDPRTSYRPGDDPLWLDWDPGEEYDGTDAGDKDYLFGVVLYALGIMQRHQDRGQAIALASQRLLGGRGFGRVLARAVAPLRAFAARQSTALADVQAALGGGRHHLAQYLAWRAWQRDELVTARAYVPVLEATSRAITAALDEDAEPGLYRRIIKLRITAVRPARTQRRRVALAFAVLAGLAGVASLVVQAALYHSTYLERMTAQKNERSGDGKRP